MMKRMYKGDESMQSGWGNVCLTLTVFAYECLHNKYIPYIHTSITNNDRSKHVKINIESSDEEMEIISPGIFINPARHQIYCSIMSSVINPTESMKKLIEDHKYLIDGISCALHIRRGAYQRDSSKMGCHTGKPAYFATDKAVERFKDVIRKSTAPVFIASDSRELKEQLKAEFSDKVRLLDSDISLTYNCIYNPVETDDTALQNCYLEWFLLSMCPTIYITAGNPDMSDFSTFGYSAATYGKKPVELIHN